jgi:hypothetical protein
MQCARALLSFVASGSIEYFSTLFHQRHDFRKLLLNVKHAFWLSVKFCTIHFSYCEELSEI